MHFYQMLWAISCLYSFGAVTAESLLHPVILVPGDGGSQIEARINKTNSVHWWCYAHAEWYDLWLNIEQMLWPAVTCWQENIRLQYNLTTHKSFNPPGIETRIPGFGNTSTVEYLDKSKRAVGIYFATIVSALVEEGYERNVNIHGAPYDFRKAANEQEEYFTKLKGLVETTYSSNGNTPIIFITHSMGSIMTLKFLHMQDQSWKDKYVRSFVSLSGVWGGTVDAVKVFAVGDNLRSYFLDERRLLWQRTCPSLAWLMPSRLFWDDNEVIVTTPDRNYTRTDLFDFYRELSPEEGENMVDMVNSTKDLLSDLPPPGVELHCIYATGVKTFERLVYSPGYYPNYDPSYVYGDGDGTVNLRSLEGCLKWENLQNQSVHQKIVNSGVDHLQLIKDAPTVEYVKEVVSGYNKEMHANFDSVRITII